MIFGGVCFRRDVANFFCSAFEIVGLGRPLLVAPLGVELERPQICAKKQRTDGLTVCPLIF